MGVILALVYRIIPIPESSYFISNYKSHSINTPEKIFYDLGYMEIPSNNLNRYFNYCKFNGNRRCHKGFKTFYAYLDEALFKIKFVARSNGYEKDPVWICEYIIPDDVLTEHAGYGIYEICDWRFFGIYGDDSSGIIVPESKEFQIPINKLTHLDEVKEKIDKELLTNLQKSYENNLNDLTTYLYSKGIKKIEDLYVNEDITEIFESSISNAGIFFASPFVTGRCFLVSIQDVYKNYEFIRNLGKEHINNNEKFEELSRKLDLRK